MDDFRVGSLGSAGWYTRPAKDELKKRSRHAQIDPPEEPADRVVLSSSAETEDNSSGDPTDSSSHEPVA
jgi:hypothetical protein